MKKLIIAALTLASFSVQAQKNVFLDQSFWRSNPNVAAVQAEIDKGSNPSQLNPMSFDAVVMAINAQAPNESIKFLLAQKGNDVNKLTHDGRTYMFWAATRGNTEIMEYLVSKGAKADVKDSHGYTPLNFAASSGQTNTKVYDICLSAGADLKKDLTEEGANALLLAIPNDKDLTITNYFISKGLTLKSTDAAGNTAFNYAAKAGNIDLLKTLIQKGVTYNNNAMILASVGTRGGANTLEVYQYLESLKIKPTAVNANGENALHAVVRKPKQAEIIKYFLSKGVDVNQPDNEGTTAFMNAAAASRDTATIGLLLTKVKNINQVNKKGVSALAMAVRGNSAEVVQYLIDKGASINVSDANGDNLAYYLLQSYSTRGGVDDFEAKLKVLQNKGLQLNAPQKNGNTLYHLAVAKNDLALVKRIASLQVDVNAKNKEGITALHKAAMLSKDDAMMKYLISIGAKKELTTDMKETAFDLAVENESLSKNKVVIDFLK